MELADKSYSVILEKCKRSPLKKRDGKSYFQNSESKVAWYKKFVMQSGTLFLLPIPLGENTLEVLPEAVKQKVNDLEIFIVERAKTARRFIKSVNPNRNITPITVHELDKYDPGKGIEAFLEAARDGKDIGLMSEAGCPGVADPGALVVRKAHQLGIKVIPMTGPSSIILAVMASGMNGQNFAFRGYLSPKKPQLVKDLKQLEKWAKSVKSY